jgi:hypothetical protein
MTVLGKFSMALFRKVKLVSTVKLSLKCELHLDIFKNLVPFPGRLCGLVVRVPSYRSRGPGSIPGIARFSEK